MSISIVRKALLAGLCGGLAEVLWVALFASLTPVSGVEIARQVAATVFPSAAALAVAPVLGIAIHFALSMVLAVVFAWALWVPYAKGLKFGGAVATAIGALVAVWAINFFVVLPILNRAFVTLMPYGVTLFSKALFGAAMAWTLDETRWQAGIVRFPAMQWWSVSGER